MMLAASFSLIYEGVNYGLFRTVAGALIGLVFIVVESCAGMPRRAGGGCHHAAFGRPVRKASTALANSLEQVKKPHLT